MILVSLLATVFGENELEKIFLFGLSFLSLYYLCIIFTSENVDWGNGIDWNTLIINILWGNKYNFIGVVYTIYNVYN